MNRPSSHRPPWGLPLRARIMVALIAALIIASRFYIRLDVKIPGHSGFYWMALLLIGASVVARPGGATLIGLLSGVLAMILIPGKEGVFTIVKYLAPGLVVDLLVPVLGGRLDRPVPAAIIAACANLSKLIVSLVIGRIAGIPSGFLALGLGFAATTHVFFGALGGLVASWVIGKLIRAGIVPSVPAGGYSASLTPDSGLGAVSDEAGR